MKTTSRREFTNVVGLPDDQFDRPMLLRSLFADHKYIIMVGLPCTGKSFVIQDYDHPDKHITKWSRQPIFDMLFSNGERDEKFNSNVAKFEGEVIPALIERQYHQVIVDGWNRTKGGRAQLIGLMPQNRGSILCVVCDGPQKTIVKRMMQDPRYALRTQADIEDWVKHLYESTQWPSFKEGFDQIVYLNTFGTEGVDYLKRHVIQRTK